MPSPEAIGDRLRECPDCGLFQHMPALPRRSVARCGRCGAVLQRSRTDPMQRGLALATTGLVMFLLATQLDFISLDVRGLSRDTTLFTGPVQLEQHGMWEIAIVVLVTTFAAPLVRLCGLAWVLIGLRLETPPGGLHVVFRWVERLAPWSMVEVFLLGVFVAYTKLIDLAQVHVGGAVYALAGLMLAQAAADMVLSPEAVWEALEAKGAVHGPDGTHGALNGCDCCGLVSDAVLACPRCGARPRRRKPDGIGRTWALLAAAAILYIPANMLPVMTYVSLGRGDPSTILGGVMELAASGMWPLALLVFFASVTVPVLKLIGLSYLMITTMRGSPAHLRQRTQIYRIVDSIGRWSMIDVFMISILTALVRMGTLASVFPGTGVLAFCAVVILTMLAAMSFDPRVMWDNAGRARARPAVAVQAGAIQAGALEAGNR